jgi:hypothetical protein
MRHDRARDRVGMPKAVSEDVARRGLAKIEEAKGLRVVRREAERHERFA